MSKTITATIQILDKPYEVTCAPEEEDELSASAELVDDRMREIQDTGQVVGLERLAVMAALTIAHDYIKITTAATQTTAELTERIAATIEEANSSPG